MCLHLYLKSSLHGLTSADDPRLKLKLKSGFAATSFNATAWQWYPIPLAGTSHVVFNKYSLGVCSWLRRELRRKPVKWQEGQVSISLGIQYHLKKQNKNRSQLHPALVSQCTQEV